MLNARSVFLIFSLISLTSSSAVLGQPLKEVPAYALKAGDKAPALHADLILQTPELKDISWEAFRDHVVILDFWATWCGPCVGGIPHLNSLIAKFRESPEVRFIAVGHENQRRVSWFLKNHPIDTWVFLDTSLSMFKSYTAFGIPHTVIVDRRGNVAAVLSPKNVTEELINSILAGEKPVVPKLPPEAYFNPETAADYFRLVGRKDPPAKE